MKKLIGWLLFWIALALGLTSYLGTRQNEFELQAAKAAFTLEASRLGSRCPLSDARAQQESLEALAVCSGFGLIGYDAFGRYPKTAASVFNTFGGDELFKKVLEEYGHRVIPVVAYATSNPSWTAQGGATVAEWLRQFRTGEEMRFNIAKLKPEQYGMLALYAISERGHEFLAEFEIVNGVGVHRPGTSAFNFAKNLLVGGIADIERVLVRGERLPSWQEVGMAALNVAIISSVVSASVTTLHLAKGKLVGASLFAKFGTASVAAFKSVAVVGTAGAIYVAFTRPDLFAEGAGWVAEQVGLPRWSGVFAAYLLVSAIIVLMLRALITLVLLLFAPVRFVTKLVLPRSR